MYVCLAVLTQARRDLAAKPEPDETLHEAETGIPSSSGSAPTINLRRTGTRRNPLIPTTVITAPAVSGQLAVRRTSASDLNATSAATGVARGSASSRHSGREATRSTARGATGKPTGSE